MKRMVSTLLLMMGILALAGCAGTTSAPTMSTTLPTTSFTTTTISTATTVDLAVSLKARGQAWFDFLPTIKDSEDATLKQIEAFLEPATGMQARVVGYAKYWSSLVAKANPPVERKTLGVVVSADGTAGAVLDGYVGNISSGVLAHFVDVSWWKLIDGQWFRAVNVQESLAVAGAGPAPMTSPIRLGDSVWALGWAITVDTLKASSKPDMTAQGLFLVAQMDIINHGTGPLDPSKYSIGLVDSAGRTFAETSSLGAYLDQTEERDFSPMDAGSERWISYIFAVPTDVDLTTLKFTVR